MRRARKRSTAAIVLTVAGAATLIDHVPSSAQRDASVPDASTPDASVPSASPRLARHQMIWRDETGRCSFTHDARPGPCPRGAACNPPRPRPVLCPDELDRPGTITGVRYGRCELELHGERKRIVECPEVFVRGVHALPGNPVRIPGEVYDPPANPYLK